MTTTMHLSRSTLTVGVLILLVASNGEAAGTTTNTLSATPRYKDSPTLDDFLLESKAVYDESMGDMKAKRVHPDDRLKVAEANKKVITVNKDGTGDFKTVSDAVKSIPAGNTRRIIIKIGPGVYKEKVRIEKTQDYVTFYGDPNDMPTITFGSTAKEVGTWESATVAVRSKYFMAVNIVFENSAPYPAMGAEGGQAVAFRISGDKAAFYGCRFHGYQDTLCDDVGNHYYKDCYIRGMEDFIFGNARSLYENCEIESVSKEGMTAITAQGREKTADKSGFAFVHCTIKGTGRAYLSRAWRSNARVVFLYCSMGEVVNPTGWDDWGDKKNQDTVFYAEYKCTGPGATSTDRAKYSTNLTPEQAEPFMSITFVHGNTWINPPPTL